MTRQEFAGAVRHLCVFFAHQEPPPGQMEAWYAVLEPHPGGPYLEQAVRQLELEERDFPRNLPRALLAHLPPLRPEERPVVPCEHCRSTGILHAQRLDGQGGVALGADYSFRCGHCRQSPCLSLPLATREELPGLGFAPCG
jgi:hypothetical protein